MDTVRVSNFAKLFKLFQSGISTLIIAFVFLLPLFIVPSSAVTLENSKGLLVFVVAVIAFVLWIAARLKDGKFYVPDRKIFLAMAAVLLTAFISSIFSSSPYGSFFNGFGIGTFAFITSVGVLMYIVAISFSSKTKIYYLFMAFLCSALLIGLFQLLKLFFPGVSFAPLYQVTSNLVGKWNEIAIFFGLAAIISMVTLEMVHADKKIRGGLFALFALSLFFLILVNFTVVWLVLGIFSLIFFVYVIVVNRTSASASENKISYIALTALVLSVVFLMFGTRISGSLGQYFHIAELDAWPTWSSTVEVTKSSLVKNPVVGVGLNRYFEEWLQSKPSGVNETILWNVDFNYAVGFIPTLIVSTGLVGFLAWAVLVVLFLIAGFKGIFAKVTDIFSKYLIVTSFFAAIYLWIMNIIYTPTAVLFTLTFVFTGLAIAAMYHERVTSPVAISTSENPRASFVGVFLLVIALLGSVAFAIVTSEKFIADIYFQKAYAAINQQSDLQTAGTYLVKAAGISKNDLYFRSLSEANLASLNQVLSQNNPSDDLKKAQFRNILAAAMSNAKTAQEIDSANYQNWISLARVYESVVPLNVEGAYENAKSTYEEALKRNPKNPAIYLALARLELSHNNPQQAKVYTQQALKVKSNYTDAVFMSAQIEIELNNIKGAIASMEAATIIAPNDPTVYFSLGFLKYNNKDYQGAVSALEMAVVLNQYYSNARYFLGLSYAKVGRNKDAITQFEIIKQLNPDNKEIDTILTNLRANKDPLASTTAPEKRKTPPVKDKGLQ